MIKNTGYTAYQLRELMKQGQIASVFTDPQNPDDFIAGYVRAVNPRTTVIQSIGPYGRYDGWFALRLACILEVHMDALYAQRLEKMLQINAEQSIPLPDDELDWADGDSISVMLHHARRGQRVVTAWTSDEAYTGFVDSLDDLRVKMTLLDFLGERSGDISLSLLDIELLSIASEEELMYEKLNAL